MKKINIIILIFLITLVGCADNKTIDGITYRPYGFINESSCKNDSIHYEVSGWAALSGVLFAKALLIPTVYTYGYNLWEPVCHKRDLKVVSKGVLQ
jgi:hypothetical protein